MAITSESYFIRSVYPSLLKAGRRLCHQRAERSFFFGIRKFPICARCTGIYLGTPLGVMAAFFLPQMWAFFVGLAVPLIADGLFQLFTTYESTNERRLATGLAFGVFYGAFLVFIAFILSFLFR